MRTFKNIFFLIVGIAGLSSCNLPASTSSQRPNYYFDLKAFISTQIQYLDSVEAKAIKKVRINESEHTKEINRIDWQKELDLFVQADINKSALEGLYTKQESISNGKRVITYKASQNKLHTQFLKITFTQNDAQKVEQIEAKMNAQNYLYCSYKHIVLTCSPLPNGKMYMSEYVFEGKQQMIFAGSEKFKIHSKIL